MFSSKDYKRLDKITIACACCGSERHITAFHGDRYRFGLRTVVCRTCGLIFTNPRPVDAWFQDFYAHYYRLFYGAADYPTAAYLANDWIRKRHAANIDFISPYLAPTGSLIDLGCAEGTFLHFLSQSHPSWSLHGIEPSPTFSDFARSQYQLANVITDDIQAAYAFAESSFDLVTASHVLEHLLDPNALFAVARHLLRDDGLLFINVPDSESNHRGINRLHIAHTYHFSEATLKAFAHKHGFSPVTFLKSEDGWTMQLLCTKLSEVPRNWSPLPCDSRQIARDFRRRCRQPLRKQIRKLIAATRVKFVRGIK